MTGADRYRDICFRTDLYQGTAEYYDRFRRGYPADLINDLVNQTGADGTGTMLDLACGTGQVAVALHDEFASICVVDQEPGMISVLRRPALAKAGRIPGAAVGRIAGRGRRTLAANAAGDHAVLA